MGHQICSFPEIQARALHPFPPEHVQTQHDVYPTMGSVLHATNNARCKLGRDSNSLNEKRYTSQSTNFQTVANFSSYRLQRTPQGFELQNVIKERKDCFGSLLASSSLVILWKQMECVWQETRRDVMTDVLLRLHLISNK